MTRETLTRLLRAAIGDDGTGPLWRQLTPAGHEVICQARMEARDLGHPCLAGEHVLLGLLRHGTSPAATLLRARGLDLNTTRAELLRIGPTLAPADPATGLRNLGIDLEQVHRHLGDAFGTPAVHAAQRKVRRRPWWRGGHARPRPLCA
jgi:ATP-dependent Clp protease ATP-binding subunit ClpA